MILSSTFACGGAFLTAMTRPRANSRLLLTDTHTGLTILLDWK
jgi:hypothetical protein